MSCLPKRPSEKPRNNILICAAKSCNNNSKETPLLTFFPFPNKETSARIWATNADRKDILSKSLSGIKNYSLCAEHFDEKYLNETKTMFKDNVDPIPTIFENFLWRGTRLFAMDDIRADNSRIDNNICNDTTIIQNYTEFNVEFGRFTYTDDLFEQFVANPAALSLRTNYYDRLLVRGYCRLCAKQLPIANMVPLFGSRCSFSYGEMLELCLPGTVKESDEYPHEICSLCVKKLEDCYKTLQSFIEADHIIQKLFNKTEATTCLNDEINKPNSEQPVGDILNSIDDKSLIIITTDSTSGQQEPIETVKENQIKYQCASCSKLFCNEKEITEHSLLSHQTQETGYRVVMVKLRKTDNNDITNEGTNDKLTEEIKFQCLKCRRIYKTKKKVIEHTLAVHPFTAKNQSDVSYKLVRVKKKSNETKSSSMRYECLLCSAHYRTKDILIKHTQRHHPNLKNGKLLCRILKPRQHRNHDVKCLRCSQTFESVIKYRKHLKKHVSFKCDECGISFDKMHKLKKHSQTHKQIEIFNCIECGDSFNSKSELSKHEEIHRQPKEDVQCPKCNVWFTSAFSLRKHLQKHESWLCNICGKSFTHKLYLTRHLQIHSDERPFKCAVCHKAFKTRAVLSKHKESHSPENKYICQNCGKTFRTGSAIRQHLLVHSPEKKHDCDICGKTFNRRGNLAKHRETHNYIRENYKCSICHEAFTNMLTYKNHSKTHETIGSKPFSCNICDTKFADKDKLQIHLRVHSGERPFKCSFCDKSFRSKPCLNQHRMIHLDIFPHECEFCDRKFKRLQCLIVHRKTHTGEKPFPCPICSRTFANRGDMNKHQKIHERNAYVDCVNGEEVIPLSSEESG